MSVDIDEIDFPKLCKGCLGESDNLQCVKTEYGANCKLCDRPFHTFRVKSPGSRWISTDVCHVCSTVYNCCQICLKDFDLGVSVILRGDAATSSLGVAKIGRSTKAREYAAALARKKYSAQMASDVKAIEAPSMVKAIEAATRGRPDEPEMGRVVAGKAERGMGVGTAAKGESGSVETKKKVDKPVHQSKGIKVVTKRKKRLLPPP